MQMFWGYLRFNSDQEYSFKVNLPIVHAYLALPLLRSDLGARKLEYIQIGAHLQM